MEDIVKKSKCRTCGTDPMPSKLIKQNLNVLLPMIARIVNYFLKAGKFNKSWKTSIVKSLLKKEGLDRVLKDYRPVNNLSYMSQDYRKGNVVKV